MAISPRVFTAVLSLLAFCYFTAGAQDGPRMRLHDLLEITAANNPNLKIQKADANYFEAQIRVSESIFNSYYSFGYGKTRNSTPNDRLERFDPVDPLARTLKFGNSFYMGFSKRLATGASLGITGNWGNTGKDDLYYEYLEKGVKGMITNKSSVFVNFRQPLLLGAGKSFNTANIQMSRLAFSSQQLDYFANANVTVLNLYTAYLDYMASFKYMQIQDSTELRYETLLSNLSKMAKYDAIAAADLLYIKANLASQKNRAFSAKNSYLSARNNLGNILAVAPGAIDSLPIPADVFPAESIELPADPVAYVNSWISKALELRQDYLALKKSIESSEINVEYNKQSIKPSLDLTLGAGYRGIYESAGVGQVFQPFVSNIAGPSYSIGLNFGLAPKYDEAKGKHAAAVASLESSQAALKRLENDISMNVRRLFDRIYYNKLILEQSKNAVELNALALANESTKLQLGTSTIINVVQVQNNYISSMESLNSNLQNLNQSILLFRYHTGALVIPGADYSISVDLNTLFGLPN